MLPEQLGRRRKLPGIASREDSNGGNFRRNDANHYAFAVFLGLNPMRRFAFTWLPRFRYAMEVGPVNWEKRPKLPPIAPTLKVNFTRP
jgi:hypothetical protein